ncbi:MAG: asparagine synthase (glutamine-hydrolyzing) [Alphaproteobacteria bacterium]|nr:asparagine synthase (glutamine-hydrolyzing) [Alphaproteobacteria bacterium]
MCGIAGVMGPDGAAPDGDLLDAFDRALAHRGPDGRGDYVRDDVAMMQRRLAIIDLVTGDQPLYWPDGSALVANGEIYNYVELRSAMVADGTSFSTKSDCELPLALYQQHGSGFAEHLRGMYAIALHDPQRRHLVLARDPFGIKPLYYAEGPFGFAFASEAQALVPLVTNGNALKLAEDKLVELLQLQFTTGADTPFEGVHRVLPGETLVVEAGRVVERRRRSVLSAAYPPQDLAQAVRELDQVLADSVLVHQRSDVPYAMFLSGGIDSSAVLAMMARLNEQPVTAFTAGFPDTDVPDERAQAAKVGRAAGAETVDVPFGPADFWRSLPLIAAALDDPIADYAVLPSWKLAEAARAGGFKVVLSGEGGDELFAGYGRYRAVARPRWLPGWLGGAKVMRARGVLDGYGILRDSVGWRDGMQADESGAAGETPLQRAQATDMAGWLPNDLLTKLDRCLMAHGVEGRTPFLDPSVAGFAFNLPDRLKIKGRVGKVLLRQWLAGVMPEAAPFARKKGFTVPVGAWMAKRAGELAPLVAEAPGISALCDRKAVTRLFRSADLAGDRRAAFAAWTLLFYALWYARHGLGTAPVPDVFESLAAAGRAG